MSRSFWSLGKDSSSPDGRVASVATTRSRAGAWMTGSSPASGIGPSLRRPGGHGLGRAAPSSGAHDLLDPGHDEEAAAARERHDEVGERQPGEGRDGRGEEDPHAEHEQPAVTERRRAAEVEEADD